MIIEERIINEIPRGSVFLQVRRELAGENPNGIVLAEQLLQTTRCIKALGSLSCCKECPQPVGEDTSCEAALAARTNIVQKVYKLSKSGNPRDIQEYNVLIDALEH